MIAGIGAILEKGFWTLDYGSRNVDRSLILSQHDSTEAMQEDDSDECLTELFGTGWKYNISYFLTDLSV